MRILNLYAGIGGNRFLWPQDCLVTAVERSKPIADIYSRLFPSDEVILDDAHSYLLHHANEFDFVWSSPPCQSHSRFIRSGRNRKPTYPDFSLYEEIVWLKHNFAGKWVVENVVPYYSPLIEPSAVSGRHMFWSNFPIHDIHAPEFNGFISRQNLNDRKTLLAWLGFPQDIPVVYYENNHCVTQVLRNCVHPEIGKQILSFAFAETWSKLGDGKQQIIR